MKLFVVCSLPFFLCTGVQSDSQMQHVSEAFGHIIYHNFEKLNVKFDVEKIVQGIRHAAEGKESPLDESKCIEIIHLEQEKRFKIISLENRKQAENFLTLNARKEGVICLENGKLQYRVITPGSGPLVKPHSSPLIRYTVKQLDGSNVWAPNQEGSIDLEETIPGLKMGLVGMKEGEKRMLYIHPDLSYHEKAFFMLLPNALLTFEVEVMKAHSNS